MPRIMKFLAAVLALSMLASACGDDDGTAASGGVPTVVVTTNILTPYTWLIAGAVLGYTESARRQEAKDDSHLRPKAGRPGLAKPLIG